MIPFNRAYIPPKTIDNIHESFETAQIAGDGPFTKKCHSWLKDKYGFTRPFLTTSCTDALEMAAIILEIGEGDEVIMPSFNFVSTANAFMLRKASIIFADSNDDRPNMDVNKLESLITARTKAIVPVHYGGVATDMDPLIDLAKKHNLYIIENAAHAIDAYYKGRPLGNIGTMGAFSFHETKNISCGEGGMITINEERFIEKAEIVREKGTNRAAFFRGEVDKYGWIMPGSSFLPSDVLAAMLYSQFQELEKIQVRRMTLWNKYFNSFNDGSVTDKIKLPEIPDYASHNGHIFYLIFENKNQRDAYIQYMKKNSVQTSFHYGALHRSQYFREKYEGPQLPNAEKFAESLVRLPLYFELADDEIDLIIDLTINYCREL